MNKKVGNYLLTAEIGKGRRSTVYIAQSLIDPGTPFVVKTYSKHNSELPETDLRAQLQNELYIMATIQHPNITKFIEFNETPNNFHLVLPYFPEGNLEDYLKSVGYLPEQKALTFLRQIVSGMLALAQHRIFIKEFSARYVHVRGEQLVLGGFGKLFRKLSRSIMTPPEFFFGGSEALGKEKGCVWSLGIVFYKMLFGSYPFYLEQFSGSKARDVLNGVKALSGQNLQFPENPKVGESTRQLLRAMIQLDPGMRLGLQDCLEDPAFSGLAESNLPPLKLEKPWLDSRITQEESPQNAPGSMQLDGQKK